jgi:hypothetical protein
MCSICRNPKCQYRFDVDKWNPNSDDGLVTLEVPESDSSTFMEEVRSLEEALHRGLSLPLPSAAK